MTNISLYVKNCQPFSCFRIVQNDFIGTGWFTVKVLGFSKCIHVKCIFSGKINVYVTRIRLHKITHKMTCRAKTLLDYGMFLLTQNMFIFNLGNLNLNQSCQISVEVEQGAEVSKNTLIWISRQKFQLGPKYWNLLKVVSKPFFKGKSLL